MKKISILILSIFILAFICGCNTEKQKKNAENTELSDTIVIYFSATGNTKQVAEQIADELHCGLYEIQPSEPYTDEDLNWKDENSRCSKEHKNTNIMPSVGDLVPAMNIYKTVIIGYPIWFGECPAVMRTFIAKAGEFEKGTTVIPFCTSHTSDMGNSAKNLFKNVKNIELKQGKRFEPAPKKEDVAEWVRSLNL